MFSQNYYNEAITECLKVKPTVEAEKSYGIKWNEDEIEVENKLLDNFTRFFQTYPLQCMCEEAGNNY